MPRNKHRFPDYVTLIGKGTEIVGEVRFAGGLHVDGRVVGNVIAKGSDGCAISLGASGVIEGNLDVPHLVLGGTIIGDVRACLRAELAPGARIQGTLYYGLLDMDEGAEVNGKLVRIDGEPDRPSALDASQTSHDVTAPS
jgi:cytoskeletal protein CcmA (bactofilin family)